METTKERNHALTNCVGQLETIKELYRNYKEAESNDDYETQEKMTYKAEVEALSVDFRSGWSCSPDDLGSPEEFKILLSTGGPACQIIGNLDQSHQPIDIEIQYQDWGTPWEPLQLNCTYADKSPNITSDYKALEWFCNCFYFGQW